jgi:hypothetical protein
MRQWWQQFGKRGLAVALTLSLSACTVAKPAARQAMYEETAVPTVGAAATPTPTPPVAAEPVDASKPGSKPAAVATRAVGTIDKPKPGQIIGPDITHLGAARADGTAVPGGLEGGIPTFTSSAGSGFIMVIEGKPGLGGHEVGRRVYAHLKDDATVRPDLEILVSRDLGDGSPVVCDRMKPNIGGIPGSPKVDWSETQVVADRINDLTCRFESFNESDSSCTQTASGDFSFISQDTTQQFCMIVAKAWAFPEGDTLVTVRLRDMKGNPGPAKQMRVRRIKSPPKTVAPTPQPTSSKPKSLPTRGM